MPRGGKRAGSGRKSDAEITRAREMFRSVIPEARRRKIIENLAELALEKKGRRAMEAFKALAPYLFGVPGESNSVDKPEKEISVIRIIDPHEKDRAGRDHGWGQGMRG